MSQMTHQEITEVEVLIRLPQRVGKVSIGKDQAVRTQMTGSEDAYDLCIVKADGELSNPLVSKMTKANAHTYVKNATAMYDQITGLEL